MTGNSRQPDFSARHTLEVEHRARMAVLRHDRELLASIQQATVDPPETRADINTRMTTRMNETRKRTTVMRHQKGGDEMSYVLNAGPVLMRYYDMRRDTDESTHPCPGMVKDSILKYFIPEQKAALSDGGAKAQLMQEYERCINNDFAPGTHDMGCKCCGSVGTLLVITGEAITLCSHCDACEPIVVETERPPSKDTVKDSTAFCYKRLNHFNEWLSQIQGKQQTNIPEDVYASILVELKKRQVTNLSDLNASQVKDILKKLRLNKWYEHVNYILNRLNGGVTRSIHPALEETLRSMFKQIQAPFVKHSPANRKNFLSYSYVLHKFCELLGEDEYLPCFPLLKSRDKLAQQDLVWRSMCGELQWCFEPSL